MEDQEDFMSMLEDYMDDKEIERIKKEDEMANFEESNKGNHPTERKFPETISISILDYIENFLGLPYTPCVEKIEKKKYKRGKKVKSETITRVKYDTLWHSGLKTIDSPFVFGVGNDYANKHPDRVYDGELLIVIDAKGNRGTYVNPAYIRQLIESEDLEKELNKLKKTGVHQLEELGEYIQMCVELQRKYDAVVEQNKKLMQLLKETHKIKKYRKLKEEMKHDKLQRR